MATTREQIMVALQAQITGAIAASFTGNTTAGVAQITGIASTAGLFAGLPIVGGSSPSGNFILTVDGPTQVTAALAPTANGTAVAFLTGFRTVARRVVPASEVDAQPALFLINASEERETKTGLPPRRSLSVELLLYSNAGKAEDFAPGVALNNFVDAIETALAPPVTSNVQTLGGVVAHARIDGKIELYPGDIGPQAMALIPVKILIP